MKKLLIIDPLNLHNDKGNIIGHTMQLSKDYFDLFSDYFEVTVAGKYEYEYNSKFKDSFIKLPFGIKFGKKGFFSRAIDKFKISFNIVKALNNNFDYYILHSCSKLSLFLSLPFLPKKKLFIIDYSISSNKTLSLFKNKIAGILTTQYQNQYGVLKCFLIRDYYFNKSNYYNRKTSIRYDFSCVGNISKGKMIEDVVTKFRNTDYKVIISGLFEDKVRLKELQNLATDNIIINDEFLSNAKYNNIIRDSRFLILPYNNNYNTHTSGVIYDAIFNRTPSVGTNVTALNIIKEINVGVCYNSILDINLNELNENYHHFLSNINKYIDNDHLQFEELVSFILEN